MPSRYSIIQYVPNLIANERINFGVLVFDDEVVKVHFLNNWQRVRDFSTGDIVFLQKFADSMKESAESNLLFPGDQENGQPKHERLLRISRSWINSIQLTEPRGSLADVESLLEDTIEDFLVDIPIDKPKLRDRQTARRLVVSRVKKAVKKY